MSAADNEKNDDNLSVAVIYVLAVDAARARAGGNLELMFGTEHSVVTMDRETFGRTVPRNNHHIVMVEMLKGNGAFKPRLISL